MRWSGMAKDDLLQHFGIPHDSTDMEIVVYNMPGLTAVVIEPEVVLKWLEWAGRRP